MQPPPRTEASQTERQIDPNFGALFSLRASGRWTAQEGQRRRILAPSGAAAAAASNPFLDMCSADMGSGRSFTDIIMTGLPPAEVTENVLPRNEIPARDEVPTAAKGNQRRTKNFSVEEDEMLVSAWLNVSMDPVHGANQTKSAYWKRIYEYFHAHKDFESDRSQSSLASRWSGIQHDVSLFACCVSKIEGRNQSGTTIDDKQANACTMFKAEDPQHWTFQYMHCWKILKDKSKWIQRQSQHGPRKPASKKQKTTASPTSGTDAPVPVPNNEDQTEASMTKVERPTGSKKAKDKLRQRSSLEALDHFMAQKKLADADKELKKEERCKKAFALQEDKIRLQREKFEFERDLEEERILI